MSNLSVTGSKAAQRSFSWVAQQVRACAIFVPFLFLGTGGERSIVSVAAARLLPAVQFFNFSFHSNIATIVIIARCWFRFRKIADFRRSHAFMG